MPFSYNTLILWINFNSLIIHNNADSYYISKVNLINTF